MLNNFSSLLTEQQRTISVLRNICSNVINLIAQISDLKDQKQKYKKLFLKDSSAITSILMKTSNILLKIIPLEHHLHGIILSKTTFALEDKDNSSNIINDEDMSIISKFYNDHVRNKNSKAHLKYKSNSNNI